MTNSKDTSPVRGLLTAWCGFVAGSCFTTPVSLRGCAGGNRSRAGLAIAQETHDEYRA